MTDFIPSEKGVPTRLPSYANLQIDSADRGRPGLALGSSGNFQISRAANILNGFFTRVSPTEVALDWRVPNVGPTEGSDDNQNNIVQIDIDGNPGNPFVVTLPTGQYTAEDAIRLAIVGLNEVGIADFVLSVISVGNMIVQIRCLDLLGANLDFRFSGGPVVNQLMGSLGFNTLASVITNPPQNIQIAFLQNATFPLMKFKYLDFVSPELTNQQDVKDGTTSPFFAQDSLFRWYLGTTTDTVQRDGLGYPINPTMKQFYIRRNLAFPKNIKWESNIPLGNLSFQVFATRYFPQNILQPQTIISLLDRSDYSWQMTILASEV